MIFFRIREGLQKLKRIFKSQGGLKLATPYLLTMAIGDVFTISLLYNHHKYTMDTFKIYSSFDIKAQVFKL